jgi:hypothetical protein
MRFEKGQMLYENELKKINKLPEKELEFLIGNYQFLVDKNEDALTMGDLLHGRCLPFCVMGDFELPDLPAFNDEAPLTLAGMARKLIADKRVDFENKKVLMPVNYDFGTRKEWEWFTLTELQEKDIDYRCNMEVWAFIGIIDGSFPVEEVH